MIRIIDRSPEKKNQKLTSLNEYGSPLNEIIFRTMSSGRSANEVSVSLLIDSINNLIANSK